MRNFVWITVLTSKYINPLIRVLIDKGYAVSAIDSNKLCISSDNSLSSVLALELNNASIITSSILPDVIDALHAIKAYYYSIVIMTSNYQLSWASGNMAILPNTPSTYPKPNLKLIQNNSLLKKESSKDEPIL